MFSAFGGGAPLKCQTCKKEVNSPFGAQIQSTAPTHYDPFGYNAPSITTIIRCSDCIDKHGEVDMDKYSARNGKGPIVNNQKKIGRNNPCPCKSGKKYKKCCGGET